MTTYELIQRARRRIASQRKVPCGRFYIKTGEYCAVGAVAREMTGAEYLDWNISSINRNLERMFMENFGLSQSDVFMINDFEGREAVLALFDKWLADNAPDILAEAMEECLVTA